MPAFGTFGGRLGRLCPLRYQRTKPGCSYPGRNPMSTVCLVAYSVYTIGMFLRSVMWLWFGWATSCSRFESMVQLCPYRAVLKLRLNSDVVVMELCLYSAVVKICLYSAVVEICLYSGSEANPLQCCCGGGSMPLHCDCYLELYTVR